MNETLDQLAADYWDYALSQSPTEALLLGDHRFDEDMEQFSRQAEDEQIQKLNGFVEAAASINDTSLTADERVTKAVLIEEAGGRADELRSRSAEFDVSPSWGFHVVLPQFTGQLPITEREHADAVVAKWSKLGTTFEQLIHRLRQGLAKDRTPPLTSVEKSVAQIDQYLAIPITEDPFVQVPAPADFAPEEVIAWRARLAQQVAGVIRPAYEDYRKELVDAVLPKARSEEKTGVRWLPDGEEVYARAIRRHTSLEMAPLDIHNIGLEEIARLEDEYREMGAAVLGTSDLAEIYDRLRNDPALRFANGEQVVADAQDAMDRARSAKPVPRTPPLPTTCHRQRMARDRAPTSSTPPNPPPAPGSNRRRWRSTSRSRDIISSSQSPRNSRESPSSASMRWSPSTLKDGGSIPSASPTRWACTAARSNGWECSRSIPGGQGGWWSTRAFMHSAGPARKRLTTWSTTRRLRSTTSRARSSDTSACPARRSPT